MLTKEKKFGKGREDIYEKMEKVFKRVFCAALFYMQPVGRTNLGCFKEIASTKLFSYKEEFHFKNNICETSSKGGKVNRGKD